MKILWYDITFSNFKIYYPSFLLALNRKTDLLLVADENYEENKLYLKENSLKFKRSSLLTSNRVIANDFQPSLIITHAQRIPDMLLFAYAKKNGIKTIMLQHGMYNGFLKRENKLFFKKISKTIKYLIFGIQISRELKDHRAFLFLINAFIRGKSKISQYSKCRFMNAEKVFVYGEMWKDYHSKEFGYLDTEQVVIGYNKLKEIRISPKKNQYQYIAQTLVEDGRMSLKDFTNILLKLKNNYGLFCVKLHPRSNPNIYLKLGLTNLTHELCDSEVYIGHYSSVLGVLMKLNRIVHIWQIKGHEIPDYFLSNCSETFPNLNEDFQGSSWSIDSYFSDYLGDEKLLNLIVK